MIVSKETMDRLYNLIINKSDRLDIIVHDETIDDTIFYQLCNELDSLNELYTMYELNNINELNKINELNN
jgi:hypothetical protein